MTLASYGSITRDEHDSRRTDTDSADRHSAFCDIQAREGAHEARFRMIANGISALRRYSRLITSSISDTDTPLHADTYGALGLPAVGTFVILKF